MPKTTMGKWPRFILWTLVVATLDLGSKYLALNHLGDHQPVEIIPNLFNLHLAFNTGAAFSLLAGPGDGQSLKMTILALLSLLPLSWFLFKAQKSERLFLSALGLIYGGAIGNIYDRLTRGAVVDFLDFYWGEAHWPAFNVADMAIVGGAIIIVFSVFSQRHQKK